MYGSKIRDSSLKDKKLFLTILIGNLPAEDQMTSIAFGGVLFCGPWVRNILIA